MARERTILTTTMVAALAATALFSAGRGAPLAQPAAVPAAPAPAAEAAPLAAPAAALPAAAAPAPTAKTADAAMRYPDGSTMPLLNGVRDPLTIAWPADRPFSPVVATVVDEKGMSWYRHGDGSWTTSQIDANEPSRGIGLVYTPIEPKPANVRGK